MKHRARQAASIAWPAFLTASVLEIVVFAFVDPVSLQTLRGDAVELSPTTIYSLAFFLFWLVAMIGGVCTLLLHASAEEVNAQSVQEP